MPGAQNLPNGFYVHYRAKYARIIEYGILVDKLIKGNQIVKYRKKDGTMGERVYKNKRIIPFERERLSKIEWKKYDKVQFRVIDKIKARPATMFLHRAIKEGLKEIGNDIVFVMKRYFHKVEQS